MIGFLPDMAALDVALEVGLHLRGVRAGCTEGTFRPHLIIVGYRYW
jgi:hypothetical protein